MWGFPRQVRISAYPWVQCLRVNHTSEGPIFSEVDGKMFYYLVEALGFEYTVKFPEGKWGKMDANGTFNGVYGTLQRNDSDIGIGCMAYYSEEANIAADHTFPYFLVHPTFLTERPGFISKFGAFTYPFSTNVWISCLVTAIVAAIIFHKVLRRSQNDTVFHTFISVIGSMVQQPLKEGKGMRLLRGAWLAYTTLLVFFFTALLLTFLLLPVRERGVQTFEELSMAVQAGKMRSLIAKGSFLLKFIMKSKVPYMRILGETIHNNSWTYDYNERLEPLINKKTALFGFRSIFEFHFGDSLETSSVFMSKDTIGVWGASIAVRKSFCCKRMLNKVIGWAWAAGLPSKWFRDEVFLNNIKRMLVTKYDNSMVPLTIEDLSGSFMILASGYVLSIIVFVVEIWPKETIPVFVCKKSERKSV
ncbi:hypothetical protein JTE90_007695 [Oedothorax gibbosus]|uniref:Uncharacterized protein n=1 Tax=Oedothorax gibbosus TaxID=931172 RepID=A0AAV6TV87_9ARAC|nr:hypothetical protein JTE90_007695 [Oedothorax gibbosus]